MEWLNYHHLFYFWTVAREGSVTAASAKLGLAQPTVSSQVRKLEEALGVDLFKKAGRNMVLTETGELVFRSAEEIFSTGNELLDTLKGRLAGFPVRFDVGVSTFLLREVAGRFLQPALQLPESVSVRCHSGRPSFLFRRLATHDVDLVLSDAPMGAEVSVRAFNHLLGECTVAVVGVRELVERSREGLPKSLEQVPWLLPGENTALRKALNQYLHETGLSASVAGEFDDPALALVFAQAGRGVIAVPSIVAETICRRYQLETLGILPDVWQRFYVVSCERRIKHPLVRLMTDRGRELLAPPDGDPIPVRPSGT